MLLRFDDLESSSLLYSILCGTSRIFLLRTNREYLYFSHGTIENHISFCITHPELNQFTIGYKEKGAKDEVIESHIRPILSLSVLNNILNIVKLSLKKAKLHIGILDLQAMLIDLSFYIDLTSDISPDKKIFNDSIIGLRHNRSNSTRENYRISCLINSTESSLTKIINDSEKSI